MALTAGTKLGPYEILAPIGAGGMGEVYRARDMKLNRDVALKVLPEAFAQDAERMARFEREAQVLASLNHPNIAAIYGLEESNGIRALVMEFVDGPTLADRIAQGRIPLDEALLITKQIAEALESAHEKGIIHRDLKPANVKITLDGGVKVLDFGLAKVSGAAARQSGDSPTFSMGATQAGVILGTAPYMAPEQARGKPADKQSDIWAFGVVLYEMLTGRRLFEGETVSDTIAAVLKEEPNWKLVPAKAQRLLRRCLERNPKRRLRDIGDMELLLEELAEPRAPGGRHWLWPTAAAALAVALGILALAHFLEKPPEARMVKFTVSAPQRAGFGYVALSPDGRQIVFLGRDVDGNARLWLRALDSLSSRPLARTEGALYSFWSPDSRFVAFFSGRELKKIEVSGGVVQTICELGEAQGGVWSPDGTILFARNLDSIYRVPAAGGTPQKFTELDASRKESRHYWPSILPDGRHFLYTVTSTLSDVHGIWIASAGNPHEKRRLLPDVSQAVYAEDHLLFVRGGNLMAQPFDAGSLELRGEAIPIVDRVNYSHTSGWADFSASKRGAIAIGTSTLERRFTWFDRRGKSLGVLGEPGRYQFASLSPDQTRVAADASLGSGYQLFAIDLARGATTQLTFGASTGNFPVWSPDGARIAFASNRDGVYNLYIMSSAGSNEELLLKNERNKFLMDWSRDGRYLLYGDQDPKTRSSDLWVIPMAGERKPVPCIQGEFDKRDAHFSPDGRWVAYWLNQPSVPQVYVQSFPAGANKWQISTEGGTRPRWRDDGKELYYLDRGGRMMAVDVKTTAASLEAAAPKLLFETGEVNFLVHFDVLRGGQRFLMPVPEGGTETPPVTMILNWTAGLRK